MYSVLYPSELSMPHHDNSHNNYYNDSICLLVCLLWHFLMFSLWVWCLFSCYICDQIYSLHTTLYKTTFLGIKSYSMSSTSFHLVKFRIMVGWFYLYRIGNPLQTPPSSQDFHFRPKDTDSCKREKWFVHGLRCMLHKVGIFSG